MSHAYQPSDRGRNRLSAVLLLLLGFAAFWTAGFLPDRPDDATQSLGLSSASRVSAEPLRLTPIEEVRLGSRVLGRNPEISDVERSAFGPEPNQSTWKKLVLIAPKVDGSTADVELLRSPEWLMDNRARAGGVVPISVPECGIDGFAEVLSIEPCPPIESGEGPVVTGTYRHTSKSTYDLRILGEPELIGCTGNHLFWSEDRQEFVRADALSPDETVRTISGLSTVVSVSPRAAGETVFNLEIQGEHVYHVGVSGVLVHNSSNGKGTCTPQGPMSPDQQALKEIVDETTLEGRKPLTTSQAETVLDWADEVGYPGARAKSGDVANPSNWTANPVPHIHIPGTGRNGHVPVQPGVRPRP